MRTLILDAESYYDKQSGYSLRNMTPAEYILDPRFELTGMAVKDIARPPFWVEGPDVEKFLLSLDAKDTTTISHNALFDNAIWSYRYGFVPKQMIDTIGMARAVLKLRSNSLETVARTLGVGIKGKTIQQASGMRLADLKANPAFYEEYKAYALQDAILCEQIYLKLNNSFPVEEHRIQDLVLRCAVQPVLRANVSLLQSHLSALRERKARLLGACGYEKAQLMSTQQFQAALEELGVIVEMKQSPTGRTIPAFAKTDSFMAGLEEYDGSPNPDVNYRVQVLAAARLAHKSTIEETRAERFHNIAKLPWGNHQPMLPVPLRYGGAHTHRLSGEWRMNLQNLPRDNSVLRSSIEAPPGFKIVKADMSQVEARIVARLCEQRNLLDQFAAGDDVYARFAEILFGYPITKDTHPNERWLGKTSILGLGYGCGATRFHQIVTVLARKYDIPLDDNYDPARIVRVYRETFPNIVNGWYELNQIVNNVLLNANNNQMMTFGPVWIGSKRVRLPNRLYLRYEIPDPKMYGAKLLENITQALARVILMEAANRLADRGLRFVMQVHDELVFLVSDSKVEAAKRVIKDEMIKEPVWLPAVPLAVEIKAGNNYGECA